MTVFLVSIAVFMNWFQDYLSLFPNKKFTKDYRSTVMNSPVIIVDRNGKQMGSFGGSREYHIQAISSESSDLSVLSKILFAKEDRKVSTFNGIQHSGVLGYLESALEVISWRGKLRAVYQTFSGSKQGASGLLEQIAGNLFGHDDHNPWFKNRGILRQIEGKLTKTINAIRLASLYDSPEQIVEDYVNLTYTTGMYHGIKALMRKRFDKDISDVLIPIDLQDPYLTDQEIDTVNMLAYYVGQLTGPSNYDPFSAKDALQRFKIMKRAEFKKNLVINQMFDLGLLHETAYRKALDKKLPFKEGEIASISFDPAVAFIKEELVKLGKSVHGVQIETSQIKELQDVVKYQLLKHRTKLSILATGDYVPSKSPLLRTKRPELYHVYRVKVVRSNSQSLVLDFGARTGRVSLKLPKNLSAKTIKSFKPGMHISVGIDGFDENDQPLVSLVQNDPLIKGAYLLKSLRNSDVLAFAGGNYLTAKISPGSAFKPFLLELAFSLGWSLDDKLNNSCFLKYQYLSGPAYSPRNYGGCNESKAGFELYPTVKTVLKKSINKPMIYLLANLTAKMSETRLKEEVKRLFSEYQKNDIPKTEYLYSINDRFIQFFHINQNGDERFIGRISIVNQKQTIIYQSLKREKYFELNEILDYDEMIKVWDASFDDFMRWHTVIGDIKEQFQILHLRLENSKDDQLQAVLRHCYYDENGTIVFDPLVEDEIVIIGRDRLENFLSNQNISAIKVGAFTVGDHDRFDSWIGDYLSVDDADFFKDMFFHHPDFQAFLSVELLKEHLAKKLSIEKSEIVANFSLPLGTHRISLIELANLYSEILTEKGDVSNTGRKSNVSYFILEDETEIPAILPEKIEADYVFNSESPVYEAISAARNERGGTSFHLKSKSILAGKTGTDAKYKTYVSVVFFNGHPFLSAAYFGVDHNKHTQLVKSWTAGWTAGIFTDELVSLIDERYLRYFPTDSDYSIKFDPAFEYDLKDPTGDGSDERTKPLSETVKDENVVIWNADGEYKVESDQKTVEDEVVPLTKEQLGLTDEQIDQILESTQP